jgi:hypothetical protein
MVVCNQQFEEGDKVQSVFRAQWHGIVAGVRWVKSVDGKKKHAVYLVLPLLTKDGRSQRKPRLRSLSGRWLKMSDKPMVPPSNLNDIMLTPK